MKATQLELRPGDSIRKAISVIENGHVQFAFVIDDNQRLIGTITDGDIRRSLLRGDSLDTPVHKMMCIEFRSLPSNATEKEAISLMRREVLHQVPALDEQGRVVKLFLLEELIKSKARANPVVIMAGGEGRRLFPLTQNCPKPMLRVGGKPMLEIIVEQLVDAGFQHFYLSVNYLKNQIKDHFGGGERWGVQITYLEEKHPLGTAGALSLLPKNLNKPFLVLNGDVLTRMNFGQLLEFHEHQSATATLCVREHMTRIPYGVVQMDDLHVKTIEEKPMQHHYVNAGIYLLDPKLLDLVPHDQFFDMPELLEKAIKHHHNVSAFPIHEYWLDVGHHDTLELAKRSWPFE